MDVHDHHSGWTNKMTHILFLPHEEKVFNSQQTPGGRSFMRQLEQRNILWMKHNSEMFTEPTLFVGNTCAGTFSVYIECLLLGPLLQLDSYDVDKNGFPKHSWGGHLYRPPSSSERRRLSRNPVGPEKHNSCIRLLLCRLEDVKIQTHGVHLSLV